MRALLLDLDGTLYTDLGATRGGPEAIVRLRASAIPFRCVTNTTTKSRSGIVARLAGVGYVIRAEEIITPARAAMELCRAAGITEVAAYAPGAVLEDLAGLRVVNSASATVQALVVGDLGGQWNFGLLQRAFSQLQTGARLIALSRDRYYQKEGKLTLDAGPFVAALEYAANVTATVVGKPSAEFYRQAVAALNLDSTVSLRDIVMVGDDLSSDIDGAQRAGLSAWLVRTGKFREEALSVSGVKPDRVIDSVAEVTSLLKS